MELVKDAMENNNIEDQKNRLRYCCGVIKLQQRSTGVKWWGKQSVLIRNVGKFKKKGQI